MTRIVLTAVVMFFYGVVYHLGTAASTLALGDAAGLQFDSNNTSYFAFTGITALVYRFSYLIDSGLLLLLILIWYRPVADLVKNVTSESNFQ